MLTEFLPNETIACNADLEKVSLLYAVKDINYPSQFDLSTPAQPPEC